MRESRWQITWDPEGSPIVLLDFGDLMPGEIVRSVTQAHDTGRFSLALLGHPSSRKNRKRQFEIVKLVDHDSADNAWRAVLDAEMADPWGLKRSLEVLPVGFSFAMDGENDCQITEDAITLKTYGLLDPTASLPEAGQRVRLSNFPTGGSVEIPDGLYTVIAAVRIVQHVIFQLELNGDETWSGSGTDTFTVATGTISTVGSIRSASLVSAVHELDSGQRTRHAWTFRVGPLE